MMHLSATIQRKVLVLALQTLQRKKKCHLSTTNSYFFRVFFYLLPFFFPAGNKHHLFLFKTSSLMKINPNHTHLVKHRIPVAQNLAQYSAEHHLPALIFETILSCNSFSSALHELWLVLKKKSTPQSSPTVSFIIYTSIFRAAPHCRLNEAAQRRFYTDKNRNKHLFWLFRILKKKNKLKLL